MDETYRLKAGLITLTKSLSIFSPVFMHLTDKPSYIKLNILNSEHIQIDNRKPGGSED